jgi:hypothetical protein
VKRFLFAGAGAVGLLASSYAFAEIGAPQPFATLQVAPFDGGTSFTIGARVPDSVALLAVPEQVYRTSPELRAYRFFRWKDYVVFVDPDSRRIVGAVE